MTVLPKSREYCFFVPVIHRNVAALCPENPNGEGESFVDLGRGYRKLAEKRQLEVNPGVLAPGRHGSVGGRGKESDMNDKARHAVSALDVAPRAKTSTYPEPHYSRMLRREKRTLGDLFGLKNFGVNIVRLDPGGETSLFHRHSAQDEFIYILEGEPTLITDDGEIELSSGMCAGFPAGGTAHQLVNRSHATVLFLEMGDRTSGDVVTYPREDMMARMGADGVYVFTRKDGSAF